MSNRLAAFQRDKHLVVDWDDYRYEVDPFDKHLCEGCGTMRITGMLFKVYDTRSKQWFKVASKCFFALKKEEMPDEIRQEARERWEDNG